jgi:hypothetical protein
MFPLFSKRSAAAPTGQGHGQVAVPETALASAKRFEGTLAARVHRAWTGVVSGILGLVSPASACRFRVGRSVLYAQKHRTYTAGQPNKDGEIWLPRNTSEDTELFQYSDLARARARDLVRNDSRITGAGWRSTRTARWWPTTSSLTTRATTACIRPA